MEELERFFKLLNECLAQNSFIRLILGKYRGNEPDLRNIEIRPVTLKDQDFLSFVYRYRTKEITKNFPAEIFFNTRIPFFPSFSRAALHAVPVAQLQSTPGAKQAYDALALELETRQHNTGEETP